MTQPVFADVDTGVDDALAVIYLLASDDADLVGIGATAGNTDVDQVCRNTLGLLRLCGAAGLPVSRGAAAPLDAPLRTAEDLHGPTGLGYAVPPPPQRSPVGYDTAAAWVRAARAHPAALVGVSCAPLTNLALALRLEPGLPGLLRRLVVVSARNTDIDPRAAEEVFAAWGRRPGLVVCDRDLTGRAVIDPAVMCRLAEKAGWRTPLIEFIDDAVRFRFEVNLERGIGYRAHLADPLAAAVALDPALRARPEAFAERFVARVGALARRLARASDDQARVRS